MQLAAGDRLGQYEILGPVGVGGMGEVYKARDAKLGRDIALKILPPELASNDEALRRFAQEARAASALNHPNIVTIYDIGQSDDMAWIAMELVDGSDVRTLTAREPLSIKNALRIAVKIADGLAAAHDRGIVHRDLKPENVMVTPDHFVKILDFGLAKQIRIISSEEETVPHTSPGAIFGTTGYMSPEQASGKEMDYRSDQFSFGILLYEMLTKVRPFDRDTKAETMAAIIRDDVDPPSAINEAIPHDLDRVVMRCLARHPRDRYASSRDMARDLREIRDTVTHRSSRSFNRSSGRTQVAGAGARLRRVSIAAVVIALAAAAVFLWGRSRQLAGERVTSLAVVPFRDISGTADGRILADGISELIAAGVAEIRDLRVSAPFEGVRVTDADPLERIARVRGVDAVVRGTVQRTGEEVRVAYRLIEAKSGDTLLSDTVIRPANELFDIEEEVTAALTRALGRESVARREPLAAALRAEDQPQFIEAVGLLQRVRDEKSVDRAIQTLDGILKNSRESGAVNAMLARALLYKAELSRRPALIEQATVYASRGVTFSGNDPESHITLGRLQNASGRPDEAIGSFRRALALRADHPDALVGLAQAYEGAGREADAEANYRRALALRPDASGTYIRYGAFCYNRGRYKEAVDHFRKATELVPDFSHGYANLGAALQALNRHDEALAAYRKSLSLEETAAGWSNLGTLQFFLGRYSDAEDSYRRATELAPSDYVMWANLGDACSVSGAACAPEAWNRSIAAARAALEIKPADAVTRAILASSLAKSGNAEEAQTEISRALQIDPTNAVVRYQAAVVSAARGSTDSAMSWLERAVAAGYPAGDAARDPALASLRSLPTFRELIKKAG